MLEDVPLNGLLDLAQLLRQLPDHHLGPESCKEGQTSDQIPPIDHIYSRHPPHHPTSTWTRPRSRRCRASPGPQTPRRQRPRSAPKGPASGGAPAPTNTPGRPSRGPPGPTGGLLRTAPAPAIVAGAGAARGAWWWLDGGGGVVTSLLVGCVLE
jgi:hypothetical protein